MSNSLNEELLSAYQALGATSINIGEAEYQALVLQGAADGRWESFLRTEGYTGSINDMLFVYLGSRGYTGTLNDRLMAAAMARNLFTSAWSPAEIASNIDYGVWDDTTRLFQNTDGTGAVSNTSPIGYWKGQRDVAIWTGTSKPVYNSAAGVHFLTTASKKRLLRSVSFPADQAQTYAICYELLTSGTNKGMLFGGVSAGKVNIDCSASGSDDTSGFFRGIRRTLTDNSHASTGVKRLIVRFDPDNIESALFYNGTKTAQTNGVALDANATLYMEAPTNASIVIKGWAEFNDHISDADAALLDSWMEGL